MASSAASALGRADVLWAEGACGSLRTSGLMFTPGALGGLAIVGEAPDFIESALEPLGDAKGAAEDVTGLGGRGFAALAGGLTGRVMGGIRGGMGAEGIAEG